MNRRLIINGNDIDLDGKTVIAYSSQINDLKDLRDHLSNLTNKFSVPRSNNNVHILGNIDQVQSSSVIPYRKNVARYFQDGVEIIYNGVAVIESASDKFLITIYSGNIDFFAAIANKKLSDLAQLANFDHVFNHTTIAGSRSNTYINGYKYPLINYGQLDNLSRNIDPAQLRMCIYMAKVFEYIISEAGFAQVGFAPSDFPPFDKMMFTTDNENESEQYYDTLNRIKLGSPQPVFGTWGLLPQYNSIHMKDGETWYYELTMILDVSQWVNTQSTLTVEVDLPDSTGSAAEGVVYTHTDVDGNGQVTITASWTSLNDNTFGGNIYKHIHVKNYKCIYQPIFGELKGFKDGASPPAFFIHITNTVQFFNTAINWGFFPSGFDTFVGFDLNTQFGFTNIVMSRAIIDMSQKEFIKAVAQMFGLLFYTTNAITSSRNPTIFIKQFSEIVEDIPNALDWSDKLHWQKGQHLIEYRFGSYSQVNHMRYKEDSDDDFIERETGDGKILVDDETLSDEQDAVNLPFAASAMEKRLINLDVPHVKRIDDQTGERTISNVPRILIDDTQVVSDGEGDLVYDDGTDTTTTSTFPLCYFILNNKTVNAGFDNSLLIDNYRELTRVLNKTRKITVFFNLTPVDMYNLNHFKPIYLKQFAAYFYINKVVNYTGEGLTKVELIRIGQADESLLE